MRLRHWLALFTLCLLSGTHWLLTDAFSLTLAQQAVHFAVCALIFALISRKLPRYWIRIAFLTVLLFVFPLATFAKAGGHVTAYTQTVIFTFLPAVVVFAVSQQSPTFGPDPGTRALLVPSLAGVLGALLLLPVSLPTSMTDQVYLALTVVAMITASLAAIRLHGVLAGTALFPAAAVVSATCGAGLGALGIHQPVSLLPQDLLALASDAATLLLTLYLLREMHPIRASTRFLLIPLITIVEGLIVLRPRLSLTMCAGTLLLGYACFVLLRPGSLETG